MNAEDALIKMREEIDLDSTAECPQCCAFIKRGQDRINVLDCKKGHILFCLVCSRLFGSYNSLDEKNAIQT